MDFSSLIALTELVITEDRIFNAQLFYGNKRCFQNDLTAKIREYDNTVYGDFPCRDKCFDIASFNISSNTLPYVIELRHYTPHQPNTVQTAITNISSAIQNVNEFDMRGSIQQLYIIHLFTQVVRVRDDVDFTHYPFTKTVVKTRANIQDSKPIMNDTTNTLLKTFPGSVSYSYGEVVANDAIMMDIHLFIYQPHLLW